MRILLFVFILLNSFWLSAQTYFRKTLDADCGLSSCYINGLCQDKMGNFWFATEDGLSMFDGNSFRNFGKNNGLKGNELNRVRDDKSENKIYIATQRNGISIYNYKENKFEEFSLSKIESVTDINVQENGFWISSYWGEIEFFDKNKNKITTFSKSSIENWPDFHISTIKQYGNKLYIGYYDNGLGILDLNTRTLKNYNFNPKDENSLGGNTVYCIYKDYNENIWIGTNKGVEIYNQNNDIFSHFSRDNYPQINSNAVYDIVQLHDSQIVMAVEFSGLVFFDYRYNFNMHFSFGNSFNSISGQSPKCIIEDNYNNIWTGVWASGIDFLYYPQNNFFKLVYSQNSISKDNLSNKSILSLTFDSKENLLLGSDGSGVDVFENFVKIDNICQSKNQIFDDCIQTIFEDDNKNLWFGFYLTGISHFDRKTGKYTHLKFEGGRNDIRNFAKKNSKEIYACTSDGIVCLNIDTKQVTDTIIISQNLVRCLSRDKYKRLWIGTFGGGLILLDSLNNQINQFKTMPDGSGFPSNTINDVFIDSDNKVWVASAEGLVCFTNSDQNDFNYTIYNQANHLQNSHIRAITQDKNNNIWFSSNKGISVLLDKDFRVINFDVNNNIPNASFNSAAVANLKGEKIAFGSTNGLSIFYPEQILKEINIPLPQISSLKLLTADDNYIDLDNLASTLTLEHNQNSLFFSINAQNFALYDLVDFYYTINDDKDLFKIKSPDQLYFRNLSPGNYQFKFYCSLKNDSVNLDNFKKIEITILSPWYRSTWAHVLYVFNLLIVMLLLFWLYRRRLKLQYAYEIEKQNHLQEKVLIEERLKFYTNITHELRTPLTLIIGPLEDLSNDESISINVHKKIELIRTSSYKLLNLIDRLLDFRKITMGFRQLKVKKGKLSEVVLRNGLKYKELNQNHKLNILIQTPENESEIFFDEDTVSTILDNLISNSIKNTPEGQIVVGLEKHFSAQKSSMIIFVKDSGYGIEEEVLPHIFDVYYQNQNKKSPGSGIGLSMVKELADLHKIKINVDSKVGVGTTFTLEFDINEKYPAAFHLKNNSKKESLETNSILTNDAKIILVVEDNKTIGNYIEANLTPEYMVIFAQNGEDALLKAQETLPDVVITDIMMPVMDGMTFINALKKDVRTCHIPVMIISAIESNLSSEQMSNLGIECYLTKPFSTSFLKTRLIDMFENRQIRINMVNQSKYQLLDSEIKIAKSEIEFLEKIKRVVIDNLSDDKFDTATLCQKMMFSPSILHRKLKALTGLSCIEFIRKIRILQGEELLLTGMYSVSEIAFKVGLNNPSYFRECFKQEFKMTPKEYLENKK